MKTRSKAFKIFSTTAWIMGIALICTAAFAGAKFYSKNAAKKTPKSSYEAEEAAEVAKPEVNPAVAIEEKENTAEAINTAFKQYEPTEEEKALEAGYTMPQLDPEDSVSKLDEFALGPISEEMLSPMRDWLGWQVDWSSYPVNPVTDEPMTQARINSAKELGYVDYTMSYATAPGFPKNWEDYRVQRGLPEDATEADCIFRWVGDLTGNYPAFVGMVELFGEAKTMGVKNRDISGNEFFNEILKLSAEAEIENKGVTKFLDDKADPAYSLYNFDWQTYRAKFMLWLSLTSSEGRKNWWTREKSYLGPADGTAHDGVEWKFDYTNVAYVHPNFTTSKQRQTDLDSFVFCSKDKNGYRVSDFFGVNCTNADAELYGEAPVVKKKDITAGGGGYDPGKQPDGTVKIVATSSKVEVKKPEPTPTPTTTPRKKYDKKKENSSVLKPENIIDGKNPVGQGTDAFQPVKPAEPASTVAEAQHQPTEQTQAIINNGGQKTTPGTENPTLPSTGQNVEVKDESGQTHIGEATTGTDQNTGAEVADVTYHDDTSNQDVKVDNAEVRTEPATNVDTSDHKSAGDNNSSSDFGYGF